jgi:hypothetical protein
MSSRFLPDVDGWQDMNQKQQFRGDLQTWSCDEHLEPSCFKKITVRKLSIVK